MPGSLASQHHLEKTQDTDLQEEAPHRFPAAAPRGANRMNQPQARVLGTTWRRGWGRALAGRLSWARLGYCDSFHVCPLY